MEMKSSLGCHLGSSSVTHLGSNWNLSGSSMALELLAPITKKGGHQRRDHELEDEELVPYSSVNDPTPSLSSNLRKQQPG